MSHVALPSVLAGLTSLLAAQGAADLDVPTDRTALPPAAVPIHTQAPDDGVDYGLWAAGTTYKMSFHDGAVVVPYLGRDYPTNQSLRWRTLSATLGERELRTRAVPQLSHEEWRAEYDHGGIVEAWELLPDGVEQTFVITRRPAAGGDLVIRGETLGPLTARARPAAHAPVDFLDAADNPILRYGSATAVDATGRRSPMTTAVTGNVLTLRLNGAWLAAAEFPVVVDPLLGVVYSIAGGAPLESLDLERISGISLGEGTFFGRRAAAALLATPPVR